MGGRFLVHISHGIQNDFENIPSLPLSIELFRNHPFSRHLFQYEEERVGLFKEIVECDNIGMLQCL